LALGEEGVERERTFAGAAEARDDDQLPERQIEVEILEIVMAQRPATESRVADFFSASWRRI
jgi:hypothetical protein